MTTSTVINLQGIGNWKASGRLDFSAVHCANFTDLQSILLIKKHLLILKSIHPDRNCGLFSLYTVDNYCVYYIT